MNADERGYVYTERKKEKDKLGADGFSLSEK
jgi:hypothetical protein